MDRLMQRRRGGTYAAFLEPFLQPGKSLVDFGCGQGTITLDLAEAVAPGEVLGFDLQAEHVARAQELAAQRNITNATFKVGDVFDPPCAPESCDIVYANAVLSHLSEPDKCLGVMYRCLKLGGYVAIRDRGGKSVVSCRGHESVLRGFEIIETVLNQTSQNPYGSQSMGEVMNRMCREAGFEPASVTATWTITTTAQTAAGGFTRPLVEPLASRAIALGLTTHEEIEALTKPYQEWLADPDGFWAVPWFEVVARKP
jgi:ubiquinone/menaquinone biosynthesis C-methylase UbiE